MPAVIDLPQDGDSDWGDKLNTAINLVNGPKSADDLLDGITFRVYTTAEKSKLAGIQAGATANSLDAFLLARANQTGTQSADTIIDGTANKAYTAAEKTKLAGLTGGTGGSAAFNQNVGDGTSTAITVTHNLNTYDVTVEVYTNAAPRGTVDVDVTRPSVNTVTLTFQTAPATNALRATIRG
jgi:hypothetical protein